jgi:hypothetical protein
VQTGGRDITDSPLQVRRGGEDIRGIQVVLSRSGALINGAVAPVPGSVVSELTVLVFPENSALWGPGSRFVHATRPDDRGQFSISRLAPGTYRIVVAGGVVDGQWEDPAFLQSRARDGIGVQLAEGMVETVKLTAAGAR